MKLIIFLITIFILLSLFDYYQHSFYIYDKNFLDKEFIEKVNNIIKKDNNWLYTTNIGNDKIKHNNNIESRKKDCIKKSIDEFVPIYTFIPSLKKSTPLIFPKHFRIIII